MDIISLGKASKILKEINQLNDDVIGKRAEGRFKTVDHRLDWIEGQVDKSVVQNSVKVNLLEGMFDNIELTDGKIQLKKIGHTIGEGSVDAATGAVPSDSKYNVLFDGDADSFITANSSSYSFTFTFETLKKINPYMIKVHAQRMSGSGYLGLFSISGFDEANETWDNLMPSNPLEGDRIEYINTDKKYSLFQCRSSQKIETFSIRIKGIEIYGIEEQATYISEGTYTSPIIDLGIGWKETKLLDIVKQINTGAIDILIETASSSDGMSFTEYLIIDSSVPPQGRYLKIRATLTAQGENGENKVLDFDQSSEENIVTLNEFVQANGDLSLKTSYLLEDKSPTPEGNGNIYKFTINKASFKKIKGIAVN